MSRVQFPAGLPFTEIEDTMSQIEVKLVSKEDKNGDEYYIGSTDMPAHVDISKVTFVVFHPAEGDDRATLIMKTRKPRKIWKEEGE